MTADSPRCKVVGQIQRQFELLEHYGDGRHVPALEGREIKLMTEKSSDFVLIPCDLEKNEKKELLEGLSVEVIGFEADTHFVIHMDSSSREIFVPFIADVLIRLSELGLPKAFDETLEDWRELWAGKSGRLSLHQQRGLLGELIVLQKLLGHSLEAIQAWRGPLRELHDFISDTLHLEVKTTNRQPPSVRISHISQVAPFHGGARLALLVLGLEKGDDLSLPGIIENIRKKLENSPHVPYLEKVLRRAGYRDEHEANYPSSFSVSFEEVHWVTESSPVMDPQKLGEIPGTVRDISYTLDVFAMDMETIKEGHWSEFASSLADS
jgi:hypothetical protein